MLFRVNNQSPRVVLACVSWLITLQPTYNIMFWLRKSRRVPKSSGNYHTTVEKVHSVPLFPPLQDADATAHAQNNFTERKRFNVFDFVSPPVIPCIHILFFYIYIKSNNKSIHPSCTVILSHKIKDIQIII